MPWNLWMTKSQLHVEQNMSPVPSIISWTNNEIELWKNVSLNFKYVYLCFFLYLPCLDQTEAQRAEKIFWRPPSPPPPYLKVWIWHCCYLYLLLMFWEVIFMFHTLWLQFWLFKFCEFLWHLSFYFYLLLFSAWLFTCFSWDERKPYGCQCRARCGQRIGTKEAKFATWTEKLRRKCQGEDIKHCICHTCYCMKNVF